MKINLYMQTDDYGFFFDSYGPGMDLLGHEIQFPDMHMKALTI